MNLRRAIAFAPLSGAAAGSRPGRLTLYRTAPWRRLLGRLVLVGMVLSGSAASAASLEYQVKAAYLQKLVSFVDWPPGSFPPPGAAINLCVVGDDPFGPVLDQIVENQQIDGRPLAVRRLPMVSGPSGCQILYIAGSKRQSIAAALQAVRGAPSLTITDGPDAPGSIVQFVVKQDRVRFTIDVAAAARNGLTISAKLLSLALAVREGPAS
ncbi:YfiR family protein [Caulobacter sp. LARHSG274]